MFFRPDVEVRFLPKRNSWALVFLAVLPGLVSAPAYSTHSCLPRAYAMPDLLEIKQAGFLVASDVERNSLAVALLDCIAEPDPVLRDGVVYEGISTWLRSRALSPETIDILYTRLSEKITGESDADGFQQPFAALILSEVARSDRIDPAFTAARRDELTGLAAGYLSGVQDYRGFSATEGWRHGVAHGADLVLQLVLNPNIDEIQIRRLMSAVAAQVAPAGDVFYHYGEPERLAHAVFYAWQRGVVEDRFWSDWFEAISSAQPLDNWQAAFTSQAGLAKRHNSLAFLLVMHLNASASDDERARGLDSMVMQAIKRVLGG